MPYRTSDFLEDTEIATGSVTPAFQLVAIAMRRARSLRWPARQNLPSATGLALLRKPNFCSCLLPVSASLTSLEFTTYACIRMRPSLSSLPAEIIDHIISFIQQPHLVNLALVSQEFNAFTTPHLYRHVYFKRHYLGASIEYLLPFTFHILQKPGIASLVRSFALTYRNEEPDRAVKCSWPAGSEELLNILKPVNEAAAHSSEEKLELFNLILDESIAVLVLLLPALYKLRRLYMTISFNDDNNGDGTDSYQFDKYLSPLIRHVGTRQKPFDTHPGFTHLTDIMIDGCDEEYSSHPDTFLACCTLPAVERIYGHCLGAVRADNVTQLIAKLPTKSSNVVSIELRCSKLYPAVFSQLLAACKKLKTLIYELGCATYVWVPVHTQEIRHALKPHEEWLEELCLDHRYYFDWDKEGEAVALSFKAFKSLRHLKVAAVYLFGHESSWPMSNSIFNTNVDKGLRTHLVRRLPESLQKLHIMFCERVLLVVWVADALEELLKLSETCVPNLKELVLEGEFEGREDSQALLDKMARILRVADAKHITTVVLHNSYQRGDVERAWGIDETVEWEPRKSNQMRPRTMLTVQR